MIDYDALYESGYRGLIYDIDNTLVRHGCPADRASRALFDRLHGMGFATCLLSNNSAARVAPFAEAVQSHFIEKAHKPNPAAYFAACARMGTEPGATAFIGDQLFTDILGAKRAKLRSILVQPIHPREEIQIILKRRLEWIVLAGYRRKLRREGNTSFPQGHFQIPGRAQIAKPVMDAAEND